MDGPCSLGNTFLGHVFKLKTFLSKECPGGLAAVPPSSGGGVSIHRYCRGIGEDAGEAEHAPAQVLTRREGGRHLEPPTPVTLWPPQPAQACSPSHPPTPSPALTAPARSQTSAHPLPLLSAARACPSLIGQESAGASPIGSPPARPLPAPPAPPASRAPSFFVTGARGGHSARGERSAGGAGSGAVARDGRGGQGGGRAATSAA